MAAEGTRQRMQSKPWQVHVLRRAASVEHRKDATELADVLRSHSSRTTAIEERPQAPVLERLNHISSLVRSLSPVKRQTNLGSEGAPLHRGVLKYSPPLSLSDLACFQIGCP